MSELHECRKEEIISTLKRDIENLFAIKDVVIELKLLVAMQSEQNKKQDEILNRQTENLIKITDSVSQQSEMLKRLSEKYDILDDKFVQNSLNELRNNSITFNAIIKTVLDKALPPIVVAGLTYLIIQIANK